MKTAILDKHREITSNGLIIQRKRSTGSGKPEGTVWRPGCSNGYSRIWVHGKMKLTHRLVYSLFKGPIPDGFQVDHINGSRDDNRIENLRVVTSAGNCQAARTAFGKSTYRGVYLHTETRKWIAGVRKNEKTHYVGSFDCEVEAAMARDAKAVELGFPPEGLNFQCKERI